MFGRSWGNYITLEGHRHTSLEVGSLPLRQLLLVCLLCFPSTTTAQVILGRVVEDAKRVGIAGAEIALILPDGAARIQAVTDSAGRFRIGLTGPGEYRLRVRHVAYAAIDADPVRVGAGETVRIEIRIAEARIPVEPLIVTVRTTDPRLAEFYERRVTSASGRFLTRSEIERAPVARTTDLLRAFPGVTIVPIQVRGGTRTRYLVRMRASGATCEPAIYIDGLSVRQLPESTIDDLLIPSAIEGVEIYTSTVNAPARYAAQGSCGVVLFWTGVGQAAPKKSSWKQILVGGGVAAALFTLLISSW